MGQYEKTLTIYLSFVRFQDVHIEGTSKVQKAFAIFAHLESRRRIRLFACLADGLAQVNEVRAFHVQPVFWCRSCKKDNLST